MTDTAPREAIESLDELTSGNLSAPRTTPHRVAPSESWLPPLALAEGGLLLDVAVILDLVAIYLPVVGIVVMPAVPTPFALLMLRRGPRVTLLAAAVSAFLLTVIAGPHFGWRMGLQALVGLMIGWIMRRRRSPWIALALCSLVITAAGVGATLGLIVFTGLPINDVVEELRNAMDAAMSLVASGAGLVGLEQLWLSVRPPLVALETVGLRLWPLLLAGYLLCFALPTVALYLTVATGTARVLGNDVRAFPPRWALRLAWLLMLPLALIVSLPRRIARRGGRPDGVNNTNSANDATNPAGSRTGDAR
ncbi:MAG TPA: DUF2232 domain-containing protein [Ktedonobacterales bacterium]|nr:DUF2232 domain-containing protein [Ktedonobacterales bacterium]